MKTSVTSRRISLCWSPRLFAIGAVIWVALTSVFPARGQVEAGYYAFTGDSLASSSTYSNAIASNIAAGPGLSGNTEFDSNSGSTELGVYSGNLPTSEAAAITGSDYISFTITPTSGTLSYSSVFFNIDVEAFENATAFTGSISVRSSIDGFTADLLTGTGGPFTSGGNNEDSGAGSGPLSLAAQSGSVEFRFYFYDDQNDDSLNTISIDNITVMAIPVPETSPWFDVIMAAGGLILTRNPKLLGAR